MPGWQHLNKYFMKWSKPGNEVFCLMVCMFAAALVTSCSQDEVSLTRKASPDILKFKSIEDYSKLTSKLVSLNTKELQEYEDAHGYKSFGRQSEDVYRSFNPENFNTTDEIKDFVKRNSQYLQLKDDGNGELEMETVLGSSVDRYVITESKMYQISDRVYKVFEEGTISTDLKNIEQLSRIEKADIISIIKNDKNFIFDPRAIKISRSGRTGDYTNSCGRGDSWYKTNDRERIRLEIGVDSKEQGQLLTNTIIVRL